MSVPSPSNPTGIPVAATKAQLLPSSQPSTDKVRLGQYILGETLGIGSFGKVKLAEHAVTGQKVALKIINRRKMTDSEHLARLKREIQYLKVLRHPHIIKLYEVLITPTEIIMVMEYANGELFNLIVRNGKMSDGDARKLFQQMIAAVEFCHRHKIVHRDLKPENVLLDAGGNVKIVDFGLSNIMTDGDFLKTSCGSPNYAAPEVISGRLYAGPEVDVWSCGVILYVMLCGRLPFDEDYIPALFRKINEGTFTIPEHVSPGARQLITSMLVVDPLKRATTADIRRHSWFLEDLPEYLQPLPQIDSQMFSNIDEDVVHELHRRLRIPVDLVVRTLKDDESKDKNGIRVAYQLLADQRKNIRIPTMLRQASVSVTPSSSLDRGMSLLQTFPLSTPAELPDEEALSNPESIIFASTPAGVQYIPRSLTSCITTNTTTTAPVNTTSAQTQPIRKVRPRWHLGIRSREEPQEILQEVYEAMKAIGVEWKPAPAAAPYKIQCRCAFPNSAGHIFFECCLFKLPQQHFQQDMPASESGYLVDMRHNATSAADGKGDMKDISLQSTMIFMEMCAQLIIQLTNASK